MKTVKAVRGSRIRRRANQLNADQFSVVEQVRRAAVSVGIKYVWIVDVMFHFGASRLQFW